ncbi:MAG: hypothetical protein WEA80_13115 [Gemmatimonadaceae bacterium]
MSSTQNLHERERVDAMTREWIAEQDQMLEAFNAQREREDRELAQIIAERDGSWPPRSSRIGSLTKEAS